MSDEQFRLTTSGVVKRLHEHHGIVRTHDTIRMWGRLGKLPVLELEGGQRLFRPCDVDNLAEQIAAARQHVG